MATLTSQTGFLVTFVREGKKINIEIITMKTSAAPGNKVHRDPPGNTGTQGARRHTRVFIYFNQACSSHPISRLVTRKPECKQELKAFVKRCETRPGREPRKYLSAMTLAIILQTVHIADIQTVFLSCPGESCTNSVYL